MKLLFTMMLLVLLSIGMNAQSVQPILFDDPEFDIMSSQVSAEQRSFFNQYIKYMERMENGVEAEKLFVVEYAKSSNEGVAPLLGDINFDQGAPYNWKCPYLNGGRAVTGCVATAMAMIMRYYKYPQKGTGSFQYTGGSSGAQTFVLDNNPFEWDKILPSYDGVSYTKEQGDAVATLMLACGAALNMNYDKDGSGANTARVNGLLKNNFGYNKDVSYISTANSTNPEQDITYWGEDAVRPDLEAGHPLIFSGYPAVGQTGHCFVIDGYKVENGIYYYHVNWGWGGSGNSWCLLTRLQSNDGADYSGHSLQMVYNIYPAKAQGIEEVETKTEVQAKKVLRDGQLIIERNHAQYTALGSRIH